MAQLQTVGGGDFTLSNLYEAVKEVIKESFTAIGWNQVMDELEEDSYGILTEDRILEALEALDKALRDEEWLADTLDTYKRKEKDGVVTFTLATDSDKFVDNVAELMEPIFGDAVEATADDSKEFADWIGGWDDIVEELRDMAADERFPISVMLTFEEGRLTEFHVELWDDIRVDYEVDNYGEPDLTEKDLDQAFKNAGK